MAFCRNCGSPIDEEAKFCSNCGANQSFSPQQPFSYQPVQQYKKPTIPGRGLGITSMVLGIIALVYAIDSFVGTIEILVSPYTYKTVGLYSDVLPSFALSILAITFGAIAISKKYRNGVSASGFIMGAISAFLLTFSIVVLSNV